MTRFLSLPAACALVPLWGGPAPDTLGPPAPALPHAVAFINDPMSHGQVGDGLLSLNEVIQLHNRTLTFAQLSVQEQWQINGFGQDVAWADIDASFTPTITVERDLDVIVDMPHGLLVAGVNGLPVLDFTQTTTGFVAHSNYVNFRNLIIQGASIGIDLTQTNATYGTIVDNVEFTGQSSVAMRCTMTSAGGNGRVLLENCRFLNVPVGLRVVETDQDRSTFLFVGGTTMTGPTTGIEVTLGQGGSGTYWFERLELDTPGNGILFTRTGNADRAVNLSVTMARIRGGMPLEYAGHPGAASQVALRMLDLRRTSLPGLALKLGPLGGRISGDIDDVKITGDVQLLTGGTGGLVLANARIQNGTVTVGGNGTAQLQVLDTRLDAASLATTGTVPVTVAASCFPAPGGGLQGTAQAPLLVNGSHVGAPVGGNVTVTGSLPAPQLGSFAVVPEQPMIGSAVALQAALPSGFFGVFAMGLTALTPTILARPIHVYMDLAATVTLPGIYRLNQSFPFTVPNTPWLAGMDIVVQMVVLKDPGVQGPELSLPPGTRFVLH